MNVVDLILRILPVLIIVVFAIFVINKQKEKIQIKQLIERVYEIEEYIKNNDEKWYRYLLTKQEIEED